jgi:hypothetical protein
MPNFYLYSLVLVNGLQPAEIEDTDLEHNSINHSIEVGRVKDFAS